MNQYRNQYAHMSILALTNNRYHLSERAQKEKDKSETLARVDAIEELIKEKRARLDALEAIEVGPSR